MPLNSAAVARYRKGARPTLDRRLNLDITAERRLRNRYFLVFDMVGGCGVLVLSYVIRFEGFGWPPGHLRTLLRFLPIAVFLQIVTTFYAGLYRRLWRHAGIVEVERIAATVACIGLAVAGLGVWALPGLGLLAPRLPISVAIEYTLLIAVVIALPRLMVRVLARGHGRIRPGARRVVIAGAGSAGEAIAKELRANPDLRLIPVAFVDDDPAKHGLQLVGVPVVGPPGGLIDIRERFRADELIVAMPAASGSVIRRLMEEASAAGLRTRTIPSLFEILSGRVGLTSIRPIQIEDLLRREPVRIDLDRVGQLIEGETVLITGAGGSIGSEIARQVAALGPERLLVLGHGENSIFNIIQDLSDRHPQVSVVPIIADVRDARRIRQVFEQFRPGLVLHAAAHKHVPLMELNVADAVTNNVEGSRNVALAAAEFGTKRFVMISTDKAVSPTNVMGSTKRIAEQVVQGVAKDYGRNMISVRFGNVLGSRGSVVPTFLRQIEAGGPVTVTHPEMRRYFMTIPESVQLVLQAAVLSQGGEVFVLDMGEPVRIQQLAEDIIRLCGRELGKDIEIQYTGVRPGEKLYEEMFFGRERAEPTDHPKVLRALQAELPPGVTTAVEDLVEAAKAGRAEAELIERIQRLVPDYQPTASAHNITRPAKGTTPAPMP